MSRNKKILSYEQMNPTQLDKEIKKMDKKTTVYFIGFCVFFLVSFFLSIETHAFFTVLVAFLFAGFLLVYYMITYTFVRLLRILHFNDKFLESMLNTDENPKDTGNSEKDREEIPELK